MQGSIMYESETALDEALDRLVEGNWMNEDYIWQDETQTPFHDTPEATVSRHRNALGIPNRWYRNLHRIDSELMTDVEVGTIVGTSTDGISVGWVMTENSEWDVDLHDWARVADVETFDTKQQYSNPEEHADWINTVETHFHTVHGNYTKYH